MKHIKVLVTLFVLIPLHLFAQKTVEVNSDRVFIGKSVELFVDTTNSLSIEQVKDLEFSPVETDIVNLGNIPHTVWLRFNVKSDQENVFLEMAAPLLEELDLYELQGDSSEEIFRGGFLNSFHNRQIALENWLFDLDLKPGETKTFYAKTRSGFPYMIPITISSRDKYVEANQLHNLFWGLYLGVMVFAFLYNMFIFFSLRERAYFYYITYIVFSVIFYLGLQGYMYQFVWPDAAQMNAYLPIFICLTNIVITLFAFRFLRITKKQKVSFYWGYTIIVIFAILAFTSFFLPYPIVTGLAQMFSMVASIYFIYVGISAWIRKVPTAKYFLIAWGLFLILVMTYILTINNVLPSTFFTTHCIFIGHMTEVLLLSFALADRINWLKVENEAKQAEIIRQLEENKRIQTKANQELEQKVKERTAEVVEQRNEAVKQRERSDELLLNILPEETAEELKSTGKAKAHMVKSATVMFTDIRDFSHFTEKLSTEDLVDELHHCFSAFDEIISRHNIEKIKTIGDSYMAASGIPTENPNHAKDMIEAALEIREFMTNLKAQREKEGRVPFEMRIGIHTGPLVSGVVGVKKFAYDIWGRTVNIASRMESTGEVGKINISAATYKLIKDEYNCTSRGKIEAKGVGEIEMYFVEGKK